MTITRKLLLVTACAMTPLLAHAQTAPAGPPAQAAAGNTDSGDVIVHAERRAERLRDVPISATVIQSGTLQAANVQNTKDLTLVTPGLVMSSGSSFLQPNIRGIGSNLTSFSAENNVAMYVDGAYQANTVNGVDDMPDVQSVEVLKGPQGTLFGRNATGGAILITTRGPNLTHPEGTVSVSYGNFNSVVARGFVTAPIIQDRLAVSLAAQYDWTDGWETNLDFANRQRHSMISDILFRGKLRFVPWEGADFTFTAYYSHRRDGQGQAATLYKGIASYAYIPSAILAIKPWTYASDTCNCLYHDDLSFTLHGDIDAGPGKISTLTYYEHNPITTIADLDNTNIPTLTVPIFTNPQDFEQEFLYTTNQLGPVRGVVGVNYYNRRVINPAWFGPLTEISLDRNEAEAVFGELNFNVTDQFVLTAGARYSNEVRYADAGVLPGHVLRGPYNDWPSLLHKDYSTVTPRFSALYKITPRTNVYLTISKGFSSGVFNAQSSNQPVAPEYVWAYEAGVKSDEFRNFSFSAAAYYYDYTNLQTTSTAISPGTGLPVSFFGNAAKAKIYGLEVNAQWRVTEDFDLSTGLNFESAKYDKFPNASVYTPYVGPMNIPNPLGAGTVFCPAGRLCGSHPILPAPDISGSNLLRTPAISGNVTAHYNHEFAPGTLDASATVYFSSKVYWDYNNGAPQSPFAMLSGTVSFQPHGTNLRLSVWGKNLTNAAVLNSFGATSFSDNSNYFPPRQFGVRAQYSF